LTRKKQMWTRTVQYLFTKTNKIVNVLYSIYKLFIVHEYVPAFNSVNYKIEVLCVTFLRPVKQQNHW
jgi:hypothetical protein